MKKKLIIIILLAFALWVSAGVTDYFRVRAFERPVFCVITDPAYQDGGSGRYNGLGYSFDIKGNFMPEDELPGVTEYTYYLFGNELQSGIRD